MPSIEGIRLYVKKKYLRLTSRHRIKKIKDTDFTIISNNCWGGLVYESYDLQKQTPTVGLFFMASDYIEFLTNLKEYTSSKLVFINPKDTKWKESNVIKGDKRFGNYPIGKLYYNNNSIEIFFLHYKNEDEALEKWNRRCKRLNFNRLLVKFNDQNECNNDNLIEFCKLPFKNKLFFTSRKWDLDDKSIVIIKQPIATKSILSSYEPIGNDINININRIINNL